MSAPDLGALKNQVASGNYSGSIFSLASGKLREDSFTDINVDELADLVNAAFRSAVHNDLVREQVKRVEAVIEDVVDSATKSDLFLASDVLQTRLANALGIDPNAKADREEID